MRQYFRKSTSFIFIALLMAVSFATVAPSTAQANSSAAVGYITGVVWQDVNNNGIREPQELPLAHHEVYLQQVGVEVSGALVVLVYTDADGVFTFENLEEGNYRVFPDGGEYSLVSVEGVNATATVDLPVPVKYDHHIFLAITVG